MRSLIIILLLFPLAIYSQIFDLVAGPPIYISKKTIKENNILCLTFNEKRGHSLKNPYTSAKYTLYFDSAGTIIKMKSTDPGQIPEDPSIYLMDYRIDSTRINKNDTIILDSRNNVIKKTFHGYRYFYSYDTGNRLSEIITITPQAVGTDLFSKEQFHYDPDGKLVELIAIQGRFQNLPDSIIFSHIKYSYKYTGGLLTSIEKTYYKDNKVDSAVNMAVENINGIFSKISYSDDNYKDYLIISITQCRRAK